jgi:hypothetical protein
MRKETRVDIRVFCVDPKGEGAIRDCPVRRQPKDRVLSLEFRVGRFMLSNTEITIAQLSRLIGLPDSPVPIDVRNDEDFRDDPRLLPGSYRRDSATVSN